MALVRRSIPTVNGLVGKLAERVDITSVVDNFTSTFVNVPLSANQGRLLQNKKAERIDVVDNLTSTDVLAPLSANQGSILSGQVAALLENSSVYDGLDSTEAVEALSAAQGKALHDMVSLRSSGMTYGGSTMTITSNVPDVPKGYFLVISADGTLPDGRPVYTGDIIISEKDTYVENMVPDPSDPGAPMIVERTPDVGAGVWAIVDNSEAEDVLREGDKTTDKTQTTKVVTGAVAMVLVADMIQAIQDANIEMIVEDDIIVNGSDINLTYEPLNGKVISSMAYITKPDGTYDEYDLVSVAGNVVTLTGSADAYDGLVAKVSYFKTVSANEVLAAMPAFDYNNFYFSVHTVTIEPGVYEYTYRVTTSGIVAEDFGVASLDDLSISITSSTNGANLTYLASELEGQVDKLLDGIGAGVNKIINFIVVITRVADGATSSSFPIEPNVYIP